MTREHYYIYTRNKHGKLTGHTICVLLKEGKIFHGVANCSETDQFSKKTGRKLALQRAEDCYDRYVERCASKKSGAV